VEPLAAERGRSVRVKHVSSDASVAAVVAAAVSLVASRRFHASLGSVRSARICSAALFFLSGTRDVELNRLAESKNRES